MVEDTDGAIWIGTSDGLNKFDPKTESFHRYMPHDKNGSTVTSIYGIYKDALDSLWINAPRGAARLDRSTARFEYLEDMRVTRESGVPTSLSVLSSDRHGGLFLTATTGLYHFDPVSRKITELSRVGRRSIDDVYEGVSGTLWMTTSDGLVRFDRDRDSIVLFAPDPKDPASLTSGLILTMHEDKNGTLWLGPGGLHRLDRTTGKFTHFFQKDGLPHQAVMAILEDDHDNLWLSTPKGLSKYCAIGASLPAGRPGASGGDPRTGRFKNYDVSYGLHGNEFSMRSALRTRNGEMYFGGTGGFTRFRPDSIKDNPFVPPIVITVFKKFERPERFGKEIDLTYDDNFISFEFAALSYTTPSRNQYAYKMEGLDKDWVPAGTRRYAGYPHLEPGEYVFRVKGSNNDGVWNEEGTSIAIIITPPWWKTWWFTTIFWLTIAGSIGGIIRYIEMKKLKRKIHQLEQEHAIVQERDRTRDRIASDLHDDVASTLGSIALYTESLSRGLKRTSQPTRDLVQRINRLLNEAQDAVSDIVWSVTPRHDTLEDLLWRMKDLAADLCSANGIAYSVDIPKIMDVTNVSEKLRKGVYLIFKEAINNIIKHAQAKSVSVRVEIVNSVFEMVIEDDGVGFITDEQRHRTSRASDVDDHPVRGHGLRNMTTRAEEMGGSLSILSTPGKGTTLRLSVSMT
jgi:signal transduction histidine kinase/streptogramin lyase